MTKPYNFLKFIRFILLLAKHHYNLTYGYCGKDLEALSDDIYIVGYPKSGNTWLNFLIAHIVSRKNIKGSLNFSNIEKIVADIYQNPSWKLSKLERPRMLKSHEPYLSKYPKVIYIVRDPRSVAISYFKFLKAMGNLPANYSINKFISNFLEINKFDNFLNWEMHALSWFKEAKLNKKNILIIRYEDLSKETFKYLHSVLVFLDIPHSKEDLYSAIKYCSVKNMRAIEKKEHLKYMTKYSFIRKAKVNSWELELNLNHSKKIKDKWIDTMKLFGYK